jgi:hypothetical protein
MHSVNTPVEAPDPSSDALLGDLFRSLGRVLAATGVSVECIEQQFSELVGQAASTEVAVQVVHLGRAQRECMEVLCLWRRDPNFMDASGLPLALPLDGEDRSFAALCRLARVRTKPADLVEVLGRFGAIDFDSIGNIAPSTPTFILGSHVKQSVVAPDGVLKQLTGFVRVLEHNLIDVPQGERPRFERACSVRVAAELVPIFEQYLAERAQVFVDSVDEWLERQRVVPSKSGLTAEIGAGAYFLTIGEPE